LCRIGLLFLPISSSLTSEDFADKGIDICLSVLAAIIQNKEGKIIKIS